MYPTAALWETIDWDFRDERARREPIRKRLTHKEAMRFLKTRKKLFAYKEPCDLLQGKAIKTRSVKGFSSTVVFCRKNNVRQQPTKYKCTYKLTATAQQAFMVQLGTMHERVK